MIQISASAREKIEALVADEVVREPALRIALAAQDRQSPLSEREYAISLVERDEKERTEIAVNVDGIRVLLNLDTSTLLGGATVDWTDGSGSAGFSVRTPEASRPGTPESPRASFDDPLAERVQAVFDELINPRIAAHGGAVELVDLDGGTIHVRMTGGCQGCAASQATLRQGVERMIREEIPEISEVVDVTDHTAGVNPYF